MKKFILAVTIAALTIGVASSCKNGKSKKGGDMDGMANSSEDLTFEDSLAYYIGNSQGGMFLQNLDMMNPEEKKQFDKKDFLKGFEDMLKKDTTHMSYIQGAQFGMQVAGQLNYWEQNGIEVNRKEIFKAFKEAFMADTVDNKAIQISVGTFQKLMMEAQNKVQTNKNASEANGNKKKGEEFVKEAMSKDKTIKKTASGLAYKVISDGEGPKVTDKDRVKVHYTGKLIDGRTFDSSVERGEPAVFSTSDVIPGFSEALKMMNKGAKYEVYIPSSLAYGDNGVQMIPPGATLIFTIEVVDINPEETAEAPAQQ